MRLKLPQPSREQWRWIGVGLVVALVVISIGQLLYPRDRLAPFTTIDSVSVGGWVQRDAVLELDQRVSVQSIAITIEKTDQAYQEVTPSEIGLKVSNESRVTAAGYPLWARLIPTSIAWYHMVAPQADPQYSRSDGALGEFVKTTMGDCKLAPKDAGIRYKDDALHLVPAALGGTCDKTEVLDELRNVRPTISKPSIVAIRAAIEVPDVKDDTARDLIETLEQRTKDGVRMNVADETKTIERRDILSWLEFAPKGDVLTVGIDEKKSDAYFAKNITSIVAIKPGVTTVTTRDFTEVSRKDGKPGRTLDAAETRKSMVAVLEGEKPQAEAKTQVAKPKVTYKRSYTKTSTGISAMLTHYDQNNPGVFGVTFTELGGERRSAVHNENRVFTTASTYKLFVAFSALKYVDNGTYKWSDKVVDGRNLSACFDDMIVKSDNPCAEALIEKIGRKKLDEDLRSIGLERSTFRAENNETTAAELGAFLMKLQNDDLPLKSSSRGKLLDAMKRQQYRQGIPAGASGTVADKVGFLNGLLHDAGIVYSPKGTYVLVILSDKSTWANLADITKKIESLR